MSADIRSCFGPEEIEEIEAEKERYRASTINGRKIIGYEVLDDLINGKEVISNLSREILLLSYLQIKADHFFWAQKGWVDTLTSDSIMKKFRRVINEELESRKWR